MPPRRRRPQGHIEQLPSGSFRARVYAGLDPLTRKPRYLLETAPDRASARKALTRLQRQVDEDKQPKSNITVRQAIEQWLDVAELEDTTRERYDDLIRLYILPTFGDVLAAKLDAELLERFYARLQRCREMCTGRARNGHTCRPLAGNTTRKVHYIIRGALERAVRWGHLGVNKAAMAEPPAPARTEPDPPSAEEAARLLNTAWAVDPEWGLLLWLTMLTGPRRGELSALRWRHIDLDRGQLSITRANAQPKAGLKEKATKTGQSRKIALDENTVALLVEHRDRWAQRCADLLVPFTPDGFVFTSSPDGSEPYTPRAISQRYRRLATTVGLRSTRLHALRHYSATELVAAGVDVRTVAGRLGHGSGGAMTLKVYAAWVDEADRRAATTMAGIIPTLAPVAPPRGPYDVIAAALRERIRSGELQPGDRLPTLAELAAAHTVAVGTAHRALALLKDEGLITVARGRRAVVSPQLASGNAGLSDPDASLSQ